MINNFTQIEQKLLEFKNGSYYKFEAIIRSKDGSNELATNPNSTSLKYWLIDSLESYQKLKPIMIKFCDLTGARLYFTLDRKSTIKTFVNTSQTLNKVIGEIIYGCEFSVHKLNKIVASETSKKESTDKMKDCEGCRTWLIDLDKKHEQIKEGIKNFCGDGYLTTLETVNGYHIIAKKNFGAEKFRDLLETSLLLFTKNEKLVEEFMPLIELKENGLGLIYKGE